MTIYRATVTLTFMFDSNCIEPDAVPALGLLGILDEMAVGHMLGSVSGVSSHPLANEKVAQWEQHLGGDGTFFADPDELSDAQNA